MHHILWIVLCESNRFLLTRQLHSYDIWTFPFVDYVQADKNYINLAHNILKNEIGINCKLFVELFHILTNKYCIIVVLCNKWSKEFRPICKNIIEIKWFTIEDMYLLNEKLSTEINNNLPFLAYILQHYNSNHNTWTRILGGCDGSG